MRQNRRALDLAPLPEGHGALKAGIMCQLRDKVCNVRGRDPQTG